MIKTTPPARSWDAKTRPSCRREGEPLARNNGTTNKTINNQNYTTTISVNQTPKQVFDAINNIHGWWSEEIEGHTDKLGAEFEFHYKDLHRSTHKITELVPGRKVVWHVSDARINFVKDKSEWNGTDIAFEITRKGNKTELRFTHVGLVPATECYGDCPGAWGFYINDSLPSLITTGKGQPDKKEEELLKKRLPDQGPGANGAS
jgi:hypothetical protein